MPEWRLTPHGVQVLEQWERTAPGEHREKMPEVLESIADGSWETRWWWDRYPPRPDVVELRPDKGFYVFPFTMLDENEAIVWIDFVTIHSDREGGRMNRLSHLL